MTGTDRPSGASVATLAGGIGAVAACWLVELLFAVGVLAGLGGAAKGGVAAAWSPDAYAAMWIEDGFQPMYRRMFGEARRSRHRPRRPRP